MELRHMRTFVTVVQLGTLIAAARALGYSQATVTLHVQELERAFGAPLFDRIGKSVVITEAGRRAHARAVQLLDAIDEMKRDVAAAHAGDSGLVRIGSIEPTASARLPPVLRRLAQARPGITVRLEIGGTGTISQRVAAADLDIGIATTPRHQDIDFEPLFDEPLVLVFPATASAPRTVRAADVHSLHVLLTEDGCAYRRHIEEAFGSIGQRLRVHQEIGSVGAILACVRAGMGVGIVPARALPAQDPSLVTRHLADLPLSIPVGLVSLRRTGGPSALVSTVREHLTEGLRAPASTSRGSRLRA
jgi:DNA-binding transcriptional LysR family regulator